MYILVLFISVTIILLALFVLIKGCEKINSFLWRKYYNKEKHKRLVLDINDLESKLRNSMGNYKPYTEELCYMGNPLTEYDKEDLIKMIQEQREKIRQCRKNHSDLS